MREEGNWRGRRPFVKKVVEEGGHLGRRLFVKKMIWEEGDLGRRLSKEKKATCEEEGCSTRTTNELAEVGG